jgi:hypothetical protein
MYLNRVSLSLLALLTPALLPPSLAWANISLTTPPTISLATAAEIAPAERSPAELSLVKAVRLRPDRSEGVALFLAITSTVLPVAGGVAMIVAGARGDEGDLVAGGIALAAFGLSVGPSVGHFYAGEVKHGTLTALGRLGLMLGAGMCVLGGLFMGGISYLANGDEDTATRWLVAGMVIAGFPALAALGLALADLLDAPGAVRRRMRRRVREQRARRGLASLQVVPLVVPDARHGKLLGFSAAMRF